MSEPSSKDILDMLEKKIDKRVKQGHKVCTKSILEMYTLIGQYIPKQCSSCKKEKPAKNFYRNRKVCKGCFADMYLKRKDKQAKKQDNNKHTQKPTNGPTKPTIKPNKVINSDNKTQKQDNNKPTTKPTNKPITTKPTKPNKPKKKNKLNNQAKKNIVLPMTSYTARYLM